MTKKTRRLFTDEQKAEAVRISAAPAGHVTQSGKPVSHIAREMGLTESALRQWVKQAQTDHQSDPQGQLTSAERKELPASAAGSKKTATFCYARASL